MVYIVKGKKTDVYCSVYIVKVAEPGGDRTRDIPITSQTRIRLSHEG